MRADTEGREAEGELVGLGELLGQLLPVPAEWVRWDLGPELRVEPRRGDAWLLESRNTHTWRWFILRYAGQFQQLVSERPERDLGERDHRRAYDRPLMSPITFVAMGSMRSNWMPTPSCRTVPMASVDRECCGT